MKILLTGHKGYLGSKLYNKLKSLNYEVIGIDIKDGETIEHCLPDENIDYVFHMAALPRVEYSVKNPSYTLKSNVYNTSILLEWSKRRSIKRFIFSSSSSIYGEGNGPKSPYGLHKLMSEMECKMYSELYNLDTVSLRYFNVFSEDQPYNGSYSTAICSWMEMIKQNKPLRLDGDGTQTRDFIHADDIISANIFCMDYKDRFNGKYFDVGNGFSISLNEIKKIINLHNNVEWVKGPSRIGDVQHTLANIEDIKKHGWNPTIDVYEKINKCFNGVN